MLGLNTETWISLGILGAVISTIGATLGIILKDYFFNRSLENWKQTMTLQRIYKKYRDPLLLSATEFASRLGEIILQYPTVYLKSSVLKLKPRQQLKNNADPYYQQYKLISTAYRFSAFFAWLELYRQEITFLNSGNDRHAKKFNTAINKLRIDLADAQINKAEDWPSWRDTLIFREELRAIGESLIETIAENRSVIGYGKYVERLESADANPVKRWHPVVLNFYLDLESEKDFRFIRLKRLYIHLVELIKTINNPTVEEHILRLYNKLRNEISDSE